MIVARLPTTVGRRLPRVTLLCPAKVQQRRWAQVHDLRFLATTQAPRNVAEKYREKLDRKAQSEGLRDISELKAAYADRIQDLKNRDSISAPGLDALLADEEPDTQKRNESQSQSLHTRTHTQIRPPPSTRSRSTAQGAVKPLSEILFLPRVRKLSTEEVTDAWRQHHAKASNSLCAVIPTATYRTISRTAHLHPAFVLPVPRPGQGAEIHYLQWVYDAASKTKTVLFTHLAEYKARGEWAQPHTTVTHYVDDGDGDGRGSGLSHDSNQGVVLMSGAVQKDRGVSVADAQWLLMLLQRFYCEESAIGGTGGGAKSAKRWLLEDFSRGNWNFSIEKLLKECETLF
ncbi:ATP11 protein-domain-containing protein [Hypoxylon argillaceum]|nr:ATP11 protein-domain-containing protein [Hypoxylon argillaceum]